MKHAFALLRSFLVQPDLQLVCSGDSARGIDIGTPPWLLAPCKHLFMLLMLACHGRDGLIFSIACEHSHSMS